MVLGLGFCRLGFMGRQAVVGEANVGHARNLWSSRVNNVALVPARCR